MPCYKVVFEPGFRRDYKRVIRRYPYIGRELEEVIAAAIETGEIPSGYRPHELDNAGGNYNGHWEFHLSDGVVDVLVIYLGHKSNPVIRFVRMGSYAELFQGERK